MTMVVSNPLQGHEAGTDTRLVLNGATTEVAHHGMGRAPQPKFANIYAPSGFDMLGILVGLSHSIPWQLQLTLVR
jgi:hypothetical protein